MFDFLKRKEFAEITRLNNELLMEKRRADELQVIQQENQIKINSLNMELETLKPYMEIRDIEREKKCINEKFSKEQEYYSNQIEHCQKIITEKKQEINLLNDEIDTLSDEILLQTYGIYTPLYDFQKLEDYKERLEEIRNQEKQMIRDKEAGVSSIDWTVDGSISKGRAQTNQRIKQMIRCFNIECDLLIDKVKFNNIEAFMQKIRHTAEIINKLNDKWGISVSNNYVDLKIDELRVAYEYAKKKQEEKDRIAEIRRIQKEEERVQKELEEARKDIVKEQTHYNNALQDIIDRINNESSIETEYLLEKKAEIEKHLTELDQKLKDIDYREANKRAGYVYIISNIGSFGENIYKIGMTRRLNPMERVDELGDASVPFKFDVHALIFSDDAPTLETALHHAFEDRKVNMVNARREFYRVTLEEIESVVKSNYDKTVEFIKVPLAEQYRESLRLYNKNDLPTSC